MNIKKLALGSVLFLCLAVVFAYMANVFEPKVTPKAPAMQSMMSDERSLYIETMLLQPTLIDREYDFPGTISAKQRASITSQLNARVSAVYVDVGQRVEKGTVLLELDNKDLVARMDQSKQNLNASRAQLLAAENEFNRVSELVDRKLLSQSDFDRAKSSFDMSRANVLQAQAGLQEANTLYQYSIIIAPFTGIVTEKQVNPGDGATIGKVLLSMYSPDIMEIETHISENLLDAVKIGASLDFEIPRLEYQGEATVTEIMPSADLGSRSFVVKLALIVNDANHVQALYPGSYVRVMVVDGQEPQLIVPMEAIYQVGQLDYVQIVKDGKLKTRLVQLNQQYQVTKGLESGDILVMNPQVSELR